ncbi:MAG: TIGR03943 family protein [Nocardioides sp.]|uniref:TIGR03943 family putative permease subunit n=1 Tax=Nocardioides sp. TaxID=35761 RepID=UPI0039E42E2C
MSRRTQGLVVALLAAVLLRLAWSGEYLRFVLPWMRWPIVGAGLVLALMALGPALSRGPEGERVPWSTWLLLAPTIVVFAVSPPPLGAYLAEHRPSQAAAEPATALPPALVILPDTGSGPRSIGVDDLTWDAAQDDDPMQLTGVPLTMDGFVSGTGDAWYLTRLVIFCCAADAVVERVEIRGAPAPARNRWVRVTGTWVPQTGRNGTDPVLEASEVTRIPTPKDPYGAG